MAKQQYFHIVVLGQTGVGKSELINYLTNEPLRATGAGLPVTEKGFHATDTKIEDMVVTITDAWGIEQGRLAEWQKSFTKFQKNYSIDLALYCIDASTARVQATDQHLINEIAQNLPVVAILTKANTLTQQQIYDMAQLIPCRTIAVNSKAERYFDGTASTSFGRERVIDAIRTYYQAPTQKRRFLGGIRFGKNK